MCLILFRLLSQNPATTQHINRENLILTVLEAGNSKIKVPAGSRSGESSVPGFLTVSSCDGSGLGRLGFSFRRTLITFRRLYPQDPSTSQRPYLLILSARYRDFNTWILGSTNIQTTAIRYVGDCTIISRINNPQQTSVT